ncbi:MAG: hypothetical protein AAGG75_21515 [Bacteroidota bacterium]
MKIRLLYFPLLFCTLSLGAQSYKTAAGLRLGGGIGFTAKHEIFKKTTLEAILQAQSKQDRTSFTLLYEQHHNLLFRRVNFYLGAGPHLSWQEDPELGSRNGGGATGIVGIEFSPGRLNLSWDFKPALKLWGNGNTFETQTGISLRYIFVKRKKKKINWKFWQKKKR